MCRRGPWALTIYFGFLFCLLLWGQMPSEQACLNEGLRLISPDTHQIISSDRPTPYCPACDDQHEGGGSVAVPCSLMGYTPSKEGKSTSATDQSHHPNDLLDHQQPIREPGGPQVLPDQRLASLRTVVLRH